MSTRDVPDAKRVERTLRGVELEIVRSTPDHPDPVPVAYISPGEVVGDMSLLIEASGQIS